MASEWEPNPNLEVAAAWIERQPEATAFGRWERSMLAVDLAPFFGFAAVGKRDRDRFLLATDMFLASITRWVEVCWMHSEKRESRTLIKRLAIECIDDVFPEVKAMAEEWHG